MSILSLKTLNAISHLGVGKSFWIPAFVSGIFFLIGPLVTVFNELNIVLTTNTDEIVHISRLLALSILVGGIYSYSRKVNENLTKEFSIFEKIDEKSLDIKVPVEEDLETKAPIQRRRVQENPETETVQECEHKLGYLRTLPRNASIPEECLGCERIIECKHSLENTLKSRAPG